jgi:hypothetical protein
MVGLGARMAGEVDEEGDGEGEGNGEGDGEREGNEEGNGEGEVDGEEDKEGEVGCDWAKKGSIRSSLTCSLPEGSGNSSGFLGRRRAGDELGSSELERGVEE